MLCSFFFCEHRGQITPGTNLDKGSLQNTTRRQPRPALVLRSPDPLGPRPHYSKNMGKY